jgi:hypothetical protein
MLNSSGQSQEDTREIRGDDGLDGLQEILPLENPI